MRNEDYEWMFTALVNTAKKLGLHHVAEDLAQTVVLLWLENVVMTEEVCVKKMRTHSIVGAERLWFGQGKMKDAMNQDVDIGQHKKTVPPGQNTFRSDFISALGQMRPSHVRAFLRREMRLGEATGISEGTERKYSERCKSGLRKFFEEHYQITIPTSRLGAHKPNMKTRPENLSAWRKSR